MEPSDLVLRIARGGAEKVKSLGKLIDPGVIPLDKGDPDFPTPEHICDAAREAMRQGYTHYVPGRGDRDLIEAICDKLREDYGCVYDPAGIIITCGGMEAIYLSCACFLSPGDEVIIFTPGYSYAGNILMFGATPVWVPLAPGLRLDRDAVRAALTRRTKAILFNNPNNPTGTSFTREEVEFLASVALEHDLLLFADEVYRTLYYDGRAHFCAGSIRDVRDRTIIIDSFSKMYAMTGWRIGYAATTPELARHMDVVHRTTLSCISWPVQRAALAALRGPQDCVREMVQEYDRRRQGALKRLAGVPRFTVQYPDSAFYLFGRFEAPMKSEQMLEYLYKKKVAVRSGTEFGPAGEGWIRLTYAVPYPDVLAGIERLAEAFRELP